VARALAADPAVLLMDEPFGALDPISRANLQLQFRTIQSELRKTIVFVTHDIDEAVRLATRVVLMRDGRIVQADTPERLLSTPGAEFVERFIGSERSLKRLSRLRVREAMHIQDSMHPRPGHRPPGSIREYRDSALSSEPAGSRGQSRAAPPALDPDTDLRQALALFLQHRRRQMPVRSPDGRLLGELDLLDLLGA